MWVVQLSPTARVCVVYPQIGLERMRGVAASRQSTATSPTDQSIFHVLFGLCVPCWLIDRGPLQHQFVRCHENTTLPGDHSTSKLGLSSFSVQIIYCTNQSITPKLGTSYGVQMVFF